MNNSSPNGREESGISDGSKLEFPIFYNKDLSAFSSNALIRIWI